MSESRVLRTDLFTTTPQSVYFSDSSFAEGIRKIARESERHGYKGTLIYSDNRLADPWVTAVLLLSETKRLLPMIALQPVYMHPYTVAKKISTIALLYHRRIAINLISGGFRNDLIALGDHTDHDLRYQRLTEYTQIIQQLLRGEKVSFRGRFYQVRNLYLQPELPEELQPAWYLSGSSTAARKAAERTGACLIEYPENRSDWSLNGSQNRPRGIRIGVLARNSHQEAWEEALERFPKTRTGTLTHQLARKVSDSSWHQKLSEEGDRQNGERQVYWLGPFKHYHTFCPYLVGDHNEVSGELAHYLRGGCRTCILDIPVSEAELIHTKKVFKQAESGIVI